MGTLAVLVGRRKMKIVIVNASFVIVQVPMRMTMALRGTIIVLSSQQMHSLRKTQYLWTNGGASRWSAYDPPP